MRVNSENIMNRDEVITNQAKAIRDRDEKWSNIVKKKDDEIATLKAQLASLQESYDNNQLQQINSVDSLFRLKPNRKEYKEYPTVLRVSRV